MCSSFPPTPRFQRQTSEGKIVIVCAGTSDLPVAEEAAIITETFGHPIHRIWDVGVAGIHRVMNHKDTLQSASAIVVIAGMEGALASVVAGLVACPVVAVPTSVGYGASFNGLAALLGMLNRRCATGVSVVNIDNGFGAAMMAMRINEAPDVSRVAYLEPVGGIAGDMVLAALVGVGADLDPLPKPSPTSAYPA